MQRHSVKLCGFNCATAVWERTAYGRHGQVSKYFWPRQRSRKPLFILRPRQEGEQMSETFRLCLAATAFVAVQRRSSRESQKKTPRLPAQQVNITHTDAARGWSGTRFQPGSYLIPNSTLHYWPTGIFPSLSITTVALAFVCSGGMT